MKVITASFNFVCKQFSLRLTINWNFAIIKSLDVELMKVFPSVWTFYDGGVWKLWEMTSQN